MVSTHVLWAAFVLALTSCRSSTAVTPTTDTRPPAINLVQPTTGAALRGEVTLAASAVDDRGVIRIEFLVDDLPLPMNCSASPCAVGYDSTTLADGEHRFSARARDAAGNFSTSDAVAATVANSRPKAPESAKLAARSGPLTLYGAGPRGADNGQAHACTGVRSSGQQVLCVCAGVSLRGNGSATAPFASISAAVEHARDGDVVQVAGGEGSGAKLEYGEGVHIGEWKNRTCDNGGVQKNLAFLGGFARDFTERNARLHQTHVIGSDEWPAFLLCVLGGTTIVDGFNITTKNSNRGLVGSVGGFAQEEGLLVFSHNTVFENKPKEIRDNTFGGGITISVQANATGEVSDNYSHHNETGRGSGIAAHSVVTNGKWGTLRVLRNRVENNVSRASHGGGMNISGAAEIAYNVVLANRLLGTEWGGFGAGFLAEGQSKRAVVSAHHNVVMDNQGAGYAGSGEFYDEDVVATIAFEFVSGNGCVNERRASQILVDGGGLRKSQASFENVTVVNFVCPAMTLGAMVLQADSEVRIDKSIFWNNLGAGNQRRDFGIAVEGSPRLVERFTITETVSGQVVAGRGNVTEDPGFADPRHGNYQSKRFPDRGAFAPGGLNSVP